MNDKTYITNYRLAAGDNRDEHFAFQEDFIKCLLRHKNSKGNRLAPSVTCVGVALIGFRARTDSEKHRKGTAWPRLITLADHADITGNNRKTQVSRALKTLEDEGFLVKLKRGYGYDNGDSASAVWGFRIPAEDLAWLRSLDAPETTGADGFEATINDPSTMNRIRKEWEKSQDYPLPIELLLDSTRALLAEKEFRRANWDAFLIGCARQFWGVETGAEDWGDDWGDVIQRMRVWEPAYSRGAVVPNSTQNSA